ncbi:MAG: hypothetical protein C7B43_08405 [Sulfobacillus benefaciens]|uniref:Uncharacterized protein n=1 Tax=Sulfobacillus benefaciens TaxID=453960 RepID=A0A2T2X4C9_9FIRM|nr:MAG: hypothetical protein C7B43_08405 [Sulfobacillus benefaciens]
MPALPCHSCHHRNFRSSPRKWGHSPGVAFNFSLVTVISGNGAMAGSAALRCLFNTAKNFHG